MTGAKVALGVPLILVVAGAVLLYGFPGLMVEGAKKLIRWMAGLTKKEIQVDDHRWVYLRGGEGEPIVLVHGFGAEKDQWGFFLKALSTSHELIVPDLPGFGESTQISTATYDVVSQVQRLDRFVEALGLRSFHILGISMGGYIAGYYASEYPQKVKSLILMSSAGVMSRVESLAWRLYREEGKIILLYKSRAELEELMSALFFRTPRLPGPLKDYFADRGRLRYSFHEKILQDLQKGGMDLLEGRLSKVQAKSLVIWGADDQILHVSAVEKFKGLLRESHTVILENCGHVPFFEKAAKTTDACRKFLRSLSGQ